MQAAKDVFRRKRAPGLPFRIFSPHVHAPKNVVQNNQAKQTSLVKFIPKNFRLQQLVERVRSGENRGADWPYNLLPLSYWRSRRYNVTYHALPANLSKSKGVEFYAKLNVWSVIWVEDGRPRTRWFRVQSQGFTRAKESAEKFREMLELSGRVDNRRTERHVKMQYLTKKKERTLKKRRFTPLSKGTF